MATGVYPPQLHPPQWPNMPPPQRRSSVVAPIAACLLVVGLVLAAAIAVVAVTWPDGDVSASAPPPAPTVTVPAPTTPSPSVVPSDAAAGRQTCDLAATVVARDNALSAQYKSQGGSTPANVIAYTDAMQPEYVRLLNGIAPGTSPEIAQAVSDLAVGVLADLNVLRTRSDDPRLAQLWLSHAVPEYQQACGG